MSNFFFTDGTVATESAAAVVVVVVVVVVLICVETSGPVCPAAKLAGHERVLEALVQPRVQDGVGDGGEQPEDQRQGVPAWGFKNRQPYRKAEVWGFSSINFLYSVSQHK